MNLDIKKNNLEIFPNKISKKLKKKKINIKKIDFSKTENFIINWNQEIKNKNLEKKNFLKNFEIKKNENLI